MILSLPRLCILALLAFSSLGSAASETSAKMESPAVVRCLKIMQDPTLNNAVTAVRELRRVADSQQGPARAATEKLIAEIRNLFYGELILTRAREAKGPAEQEALAKERSAAAWLRPNAMGSVNRDAHYNALKEAKQLRANADEAVANATTSLESIAKATVAQLAAYERVGDLEVKNALEHAVRAIAARSLPHSALLPSVEEKPPLPGLDRDLVLPAALAGLIALGICLRRLHPAAKEG